MEPGARRSSDQVGGGHASDIEDYGLEGCRIVDYRVAMVPEEVEAIVSNPPFA
jgi:hypothetical protein